MVFQTGNDLAFQLTNVCFSLVISRFHSGKFVEHVNDEHEGECCQDSSALFEAGFVEA